MKYFILYTFLLCPIFSFGQMISITKQYENPGILTFYDQNGDIIEQHNIDGSKKYKKDIRKKIRPILNEHFKNKNFRIASSGGLKKVIKISNKDSLPKMAILPPGYHIIDDLDKDIIIEVDPVHLEKYVVDIDSIVHNAIKKSKIKMRLQINDSLHRWPAESSRIYEMIEYLFGSELIDSLKVLADENNRFSKRGNRLKISEIDSVGNQLQLEFISNPHIIKSNNDRLESIENQIELMNKKLDSIIKYQNNLDLNQ